MGAVSAIAASSQCTYDPEYYVEGNVVNVWHGSNTGNIYLEGRAFSKIIPL